MQPDAGSEGGDGGKLAAKKDDLTVEQRMQSLIKGVNKEEIEGDHGLSKKEDKDMYSTRDPTPAKQ